MDKINGVKLAINENESQLINKVAKIKGVSPNKIKYFKILKKSIDARDKGNIFYTYNV